MLKRLAIALPLFAIVCVITYHALLSAKNDTRMMPAAVPPMPESVPAPSATPTPAPAREWARPLAYPPLGNLHRVSDWLYRGEQPSADGMRLLERLGIRTVINLRAAHSDSDEAEGTSLRGVHIPMLATRIREKDAVTFLRTVLNPANGPYFVHCQHGSDRTGAMCAVYRIVVENWPVDDAILEMEQGGFGFHDIWKKTIIPDLRSLDYARIRAAVGRAE